jgi:hypothetical protein
MRPCIHDLSGVSAPAVSTITIGAEDNCSGAALTLAASACHEGCSCRERGNWDAERQVEEINSVRRNQTDYALLNCVKKCAKKLLSNANLFLLSNDY